MTDVTEGRTNPEPNAPQPSPMSGGLFGNLPPPVKDEPVAASTGNAAPVVAPVANAPAPGVAPSDQAEFGQRVSNALAKLGINVDPNAMKVALLHQLEECAAAYENAKVGDDQSFFQKQATRILAGLHAVHL